MFLAGNESEGTAEDSATLAPSRARRFTVTSAWRTSSKSLFNGECVEVASAKGAVLVRDSQARAGVMLAFSLRSWRLFLNDLKALAYSS
jgi:hypothetical protein